MRACLASFGGDQFDSEDPVESRLQSSFFNWFTFGISVGCFIGLIFIVWLDNNKGWDYGFGISAVFYLVGLLVLASGFPLYRNHKPDGSPLTRVLQVESIFLNFGNVLFHLASVDLLVFSFQGFCSSIQEEKSQYVRNARRIETARREGRGI